MRRITKVLLVAAIALGGLPLAAAPAAADCVRLIVQYSPPADLNDVDSDTCVATDWENVTVVQADLGSGGFVRVHVPRP